MAEPPQIDVVQETEISGALAKPHHLHKRRLLNTGNYFDGIAPVTATEMPNENDGQTVAFSLQPSPPDEET